jgi:hypothetical protein
MRLNARALLTDFELMLLLAVLRVGEDAYGVPIARELEQTGGRSTTLAAVYLALERMRERGLVKSAARRPDAAARRPSQEALRGHARRPARGAPHAACVRRVVDGDSGTERKARMRKPPAVATALLSRLAPAGRVARRRSRRGVRRRPLARLVLAQVLSAVVIDSRRRRRGASAAALSAGLDRLGTLLLLFLLADRAGRRQRPRRLVVGLGSADRVRHGGGGGRSS